MVSKGRKPSFKKFIHNDLHRVKKGINEGIRIYEENKSKLVSKVRKYTPENSNNKNKINNYFSEFLTGISVCMLDDRNLNSTKIILSNNESISFIQIVEYNYNTYEHMLKVKDQLTKQYNNVIIKIRFDCIVNYIKRTKIHYDNIWLDFTGGFIPTYNSIKYLCKKKIQDPFVFGYTFSRRGNQTNPGFNKYFSGGFDSESVVCMLEKFLNSSFEITDKYNFDENLQSKMTTKFMKLEPKF